MSDSAASVIIPTVASILVFVLGLLIKFCYDQYLKRRSVITYRNVVFEWSGLVSEAAKRQIDSLKDFSDRLVKTKSFYPLEFAFTHSMSDWLKDLSAEKAVSIFIDNCRVSGKEDKRLNMTFNLVSQYDYLNGIEDYVREKYDSYYKQENDLMDQWNVLLQEIRHEINAVKPETMHEYEAIGHVRNMFNDSMRRLVESDLMEEINNQLIIPLNETVEACQKAYPDARNCHTVYECARKMSLVYNQWLAYKNGYAEVFKEIYSAAEKSLSTLDEAVEYLRDSTKVVCWVG